MPWRGGTWEAVLTLALPFRSRPTSAVQSGRGGSAKVGPCRVVPVVSNPSLSGKRAFLCGATRTPSRAGHPASDADVGIAAGRIARRWYRAKCLTRTVSVLTGRAGHRSRDLPALHRA